MKNYLIAVPDALKSLISDHAFVEASRNTLTTRHVRGRPSAYCPGAVHLSHGDFIAG